MKINLPKFRFGFRTFKDSRIWVGSILVAVAIFMTQSTLTKAMARSSVIVVSRTIAAGTVLTTSDISHVEVVLPETISPLTLDTEVIGMTATRDLFAGDVLTKQSLASSAPSTMRLISTPIKAGHLPTVSVGQLVDVWVTPNTNGMALPGPAKLVIAQAVINALPLGADSTSDTSVTMLVDQTAIPDLVQAMRDGVIDVVALPGNKRS